MALTIFITYLLIGVLIFIWLFWEEITGVNQGKYPIYIYLVTMLVIWPLVMIHSIITVINRRINKRKRGRRK